MSLSLSLCAASHLHIQTPTVGRTCRIGQQETASGKRQQRRQLGRAKHKIAAEQMKRIARSARQANLPYEKINRHTGARAPTRTAPSTSIGFIEPADRKWPILSGRVLGEDAWRQCVARGTTARVAVSICDQADWQWAGENSIIGLEMRQLVTSAARGRVAQALSVSLFGVGDILDCGELAGWSWSAAAAWPD